MVPSSSGRMNVGTPSGGFIESFEPIILACEPPNDKKLEGFLPLTLAILLSIDGIVLPYSSCNELMRG